MTPSSLAQSSLSARLNGGLLLGVHLTALLALFTGVFWEDLLLCGGLYVLRMFGVTAGYHRYFSHRSFKTSRPMQLVLAVLAISSAQKGVLWWASHHRHHHRSSDTPEDWHSPRHVGFWRSHLLWWLDDDGAPTDPKRVRDLSRFPELLWLERWHVLVPTTLAALCFAVGGLSGFVVGFCWSTVLVWHCTFTINSLSHIYGTQPFETGDDSRNNPWLAFITLGEGWHNNHHHYQVSARQGFLWWELDVVWYVLKAWSALGLVWDLKVPPARVLAHRYVERAAQTLAAPGAGLPALSVPALSVPSLAEVAHSLAEAAHSLAAQSRAAKASAAQSMAAQAQSLAAQTHAAQLRAEAALNESASTLTEAAHTFTEAAQVRAEAAQARAEAALHEAQETLRVAAHRLTEAAHTFSEAAHTFSEAAHSRTEAAMGEAQQALHEAAQTLTEAARLLTEPALELSGG